MHAVRELFALMDGAPRDSAQDGAVMDGALKEPAPTDAAPTDWQLYGDTTARPKTFQLAIVELGDGTLLMYSRSVRALAAAHGEVQIAARSRLEAQRWRVSTCAKFDIHDRLRPAQRRGRRDASWWITPGRALHEYVW